MRIKIIKPLSLVSLFLQISYLILPVLSYITLTTTAKANSNNYNCVADTFVSLSSTNPSNGTRRFIPIGTYTDYTLPGNPTFAKSRGLLNFGTIELGSNAIVTSAKLIVWHYGTNSGNQAIHVTKATSSWNETTVAPGPNIDGQNYGSTTFPYYNSSQQAVAREINLNTSLVDSLRNPNNGIVLKNFDESARGVVICSNNIPSGPCKSGMQPQLVIDYYLNQPPNQPNLDRPQQGWELGPATDQNFTGITCNNDGTGQGCNVEFRAKADDPDDTFPITNTFEIISQEGASASYTTYNEDWQMWQKVLKDGHWKWRAKSTDAQGAASSWTGYRNFIIDTTAPSQPQMIAMKPYSPGIQNEIITEASHDNIIGQINYNFEKADDEFFTQNLETSGWIESTNYIFANLTDDKKYFYRVRAQDKLHNISSYSNVIFSTQDATSPQIDNVELSNQRISPVNQDGNFDTVEISSEIADKYLSEIEVQIQDDKKNVVRVFTQKDIVEPTKQLSISWNGKDDLSNDVPDGAYKIIIIARDRAGNQSQNEDTIIIVDNEPATLNYNPANGSWFKDEILHITGQSEPDAKLTFSNPSTQETIDINMSDLGHFDIEVNLEPGSNQYTLKATDITGNEVIKNLEYFEEESRPTIEIVTPEALTNVTNLSINLKLQDTGFEDYISGIDTSKLYLSLEHESIGEKVLINNGVNLAQGTIIKDCLDGSGQYGDSNLPYCEYEYQLNEPLQPDGMWLIKAQIKDKAGNESEQIQKTIELDSHTYSELTSPVEGEQFNYSKVTLKGKAERGAILEISSKDADLLPGSDMETFEIEPIENLGRVKVYDCKPSSNPAQDGIKEICNWQVDDFELEKDLEKSNRIKNTLKFTLKDRAQNIDVKELNIYTNLYDISYSIDTDSQYFSPNGDGVQDGINFLNISTDANLSYWEVKITDILGEEIKKFSANGNFAYMPFKIAWDGRDQLGQLIFDGDYYYQLKLISSDGIEIESYKKPIHAVTRLQDSVIITNPNDGDLTTRGVTQVSGQAPLDTQVRICDDVIGMDGQCDFEYLLEVDRFNLFSQVIPLIRLPGESETEHFLTAYAIDRYGNRTIDSNRVKITVTNKPPFKSIEILPVFTGVNNEQDYAIIQKKLDENVEITQEDIASLRSVVLRSNVNFGTNRVKFSFADWTNLETFPPSTQFYNLGWIDGANYTHLYSQLDQSQDYQECQNTYCTWDFYYPIPPIGGGLYEIQFEGVLAEEVQSLSASLLIDGNIPTAPIILDIDKIIDGTNYNTNLSDVDGSWRYYSNSEDIVIKGVADPNSAILISDQNSNFSCTTSTNAIGLFSCEADIKSFLPMVDGRVYNLDLVVVAAKGENTSSSLDTKSLIIDKIAPIFVNASSSKEWYQSGDLIDYDISTDEYISHALSIEGSSTGCINDPEEIDFDPINLILNNTPVYDLVIDNSSQNASGAHVIPGNAQEGRFCNTIYVQDIAGNTSLKTSTVFIDNTSPDQPVLNKQDWGKYNGKDTTPGFVAKGRLVPEYVHEEKNLHLFGLAEKDQIVSLFVNGKLIESKDLDTKDCQQIDDDTIKDQVIVRSGSICKFDFNYIFNEGETDYQIQLKTIDRSGNESIISDDEVVYLDQANPITPQTLSIKAKGQDIPNWVKAKDQEIISSRLGTGNLGKLPITNSKSVVIETLAEARSDFDLWFENPGALLSRPKTIQKSGNGIDLYPIELEMDGVYSFYSTSWDAAGNESGEHMVQIELDTLAPVVPTVSNPYVCGNNICVDASGEDGAKLFDGKNYLGIVSNGAKRFVAKYSPRYGTAYNFIFRLEDRATNSSPAVAKSFALDRAQGDGVGVLGDNDMYGGKSINDIGSTANANIFISRDDKWTISNFEIPAPLIANISNDFDGSVDIYGLALASGSKLKTKFKIRKEYYPINKAIDICGGWKASTSCVEKKSGMGRFEAMKINSFCLFQGDSCYTKYAKKVTKEITESIDLKHNEILVSKFDEDITSNRYCGVGANCYDDARRYWHSNQDAKFQFEIIPNVLSSKDKVKAKLRSFTEFDIKFNDDLKHTFKFDKQALESAWSNQVEVPDIKDFWETVVHPLAYDPNCAGFQKTDVFGSFQSFRKQPHTGVDLAKPSGCLVNSVADGIIEAQEWDYLGGGNMVLINHKNGYGTIYLHGANDSNRKSIYDKVNAGEYIFYMGNTTNPGVKMGIHLHLTLRKNNINVNPEDINYFRDLGPKGELYKNTKKY